MIPILAIICRLVLFRYFTKVTPLLASWTSRNYYTIDMMYLLWLLSIANYGLFLKGWNPLFPASYRTILNIFIGSMMLYFTYIIPVLLTVLVTRRKRFIAQFSPTIEFLNAFLNIVHISTFLFILYAFTKMNFIEWIMPSFFLLLPTLSIRWQMALSSQKVRKYG